MKSVGTEDAAFRPKDSVFQTINQKQHVGGIFGDVAKVFDCVNHGMFVN